MKKYAIPVLYGFLLMCLFVSCRLSGNNGSINLTVSESDNYYKIMADYPVQNTRKVESYMSQQLGKESNVSFINARIDADITLDDGTTFYLNNSPGNLEVKLDKSKNSNDSYRKIKAFGEGLKSVLQ